MLIDASHSQTLPTEYHWAHPLKQYQADLSAGSLMLPESRIIAGLLLQRLDDAAWQHALRVENVLQKSAPA
ncbi:BrxA family protein, partial [Xanthomonas campestris pv. campestris]